jgi:hypothetical protein
MEKQDPYLDLCKALIEASLEWGHSRDWNNADFEALSDRISAKTEVRLSMSTLKRIWGKVRYESSPTAATLNALAVFLDCRDWRDFKKKNATAALAGATGVGVGVGAATAAAAARGATSASTMTGAAARKRPMSGLRWLGLMTGAIASVWLLYGMVRVLTAASPGAADPSPAVPGVANPSRVRVVFKSHATTEDLPNSVVFDYDASGFQSDDVYIQQNWDTARRDKVSGNGKQHTSIYYYPGYFAAKLVVNGSIVAESPVFIQTKGWKGILGTKPFPVYLSERDIRKQGYLGVTGSLLQQKLGSAIFNDTWMTFTNVRTFDGVKGDDFALETTLRNTSSVESSLCRKVTIKILGTDGAIVIPLSTKGCIADLNLLTGGRWISGKDTDLSAFGCDFTQFQHLYCQTHAGRLLIRINDVVALDVAETRSIGEVIGLRLEFEGAGEIKDVTLIGGSKTVYAQKF